jgi:hypothetical protein
MEPEPEFDFETDCGNRPVCRSYGDGDSDVLERVNVEFFHDNLFQLKSTSWS